MKYPVFTLAFASLLCAFSRTVNVENDNIFCYGVDAYRTCPSEEKEEGHSSMIITVHREI